MMKLRFRTLTALLLCLVLSLGTPVAILADEPDAEISEEVQTGGEEVSEEPAAETPAVEEPSAETPAIETTVTETPAAETPAEPAEEIGEAETEQESGSESESESGSDEPEPEAPTDPTIPDVSSPVGGAIPGVEKEVDPSFIDAEKYLTEDYDEQLCWAATAANILWRDNYAQNAVNPLTNDHFKSEDEVFDYFRKCFTDVAGVPDGAIEYFTKGTYQYTGDEHISQLRPDAPAGGLLPDALDDKSVEVIGNTYTNNLMDILYGVIDTTTGALLKWWDATTGGIRPGAHWLTVIGLEKGGDYGYSGIWLADSDNDPAVDIYPGVTDPVKRAELAASMPNSQTYYPLTYEELGDIFCWIVNGFSGSDETTKVLISHICAIMNNDDEDDDDDTDDNNETSSSSNSSSESAQQTYSNEQIAEFAFAQLKAMMIDQGLSAYSPTGYVFDRSSNTGYSLIIRRASTMVRNVYFDGVRLADNGKYYTITRNPEGLFTITFTSEFMKSLNDGSHTLKMEFDGSDDIDATITVK
ncbi:MAG: hypothetical protein IKO16_08290 [Lachnospiraceae bacterium]|nr:hypothetical protein [Lachnospiraceae bacterium]